MPRKTTVEKLESHPGEAQNEEQVLRVIAAILDSSDESEY